MWCTSSSIVSRSQDRRFVEQISNLKQWLVQSRLPVNQLEERLPANNWPPRLLVRVPQPLAVSRSLTVIGLVLLPSVRSVVTRNRLSSSFASSLSRDWSVKLLKISRLISDSRVLLWLLSRRPVKPTSLVCLRIPTCVPSTPRGSPSCPRTSSWLVVSVEREHKLFTFSIYFQPALLRATTFNKRSHRCLYTPHS